MLLKSILLPVATLVSVVAADGAAIVAAMTVVASESTALNNAVASWNGNIFGLFPILIDSTKLLEDIYSATSTAKASANLNNLEGFGVAQATVALSTNVQSTLAAIVAKKAEFAHLFLQIAILLELEAEKKATDDFAAAVTAKLPAALAALAPNLIKPIDDAFNSAIAVYQQ